MRLASILLLIGNVGLRNLWLYRIKTAVIALLLTLGTFIAVVGMSLLQDIESSMRDSIVSSVAGHLQLYSGKGKDELAIFGSSFMGRSDIGTLQDFAPYRDEVLKHPNVAAFIPMGLDMAFLGRGNELDDMLEALRAGLKSADKQLISDRVELLRFQLQQLKKELNEQRKLSRDITKIEQQLADVAKVEMPGFLDQLTQKDEEKLQFLETRIAPLSGEKFPIYLMYLGTDITLFEPNFSKFKIVSGQSLAAGQRGILIGQKVREEQLKNLVARLFDRLYKRVIRSGMTIADDAENRRYAADLPRQYTRILNYLDRRESAELSQKLSDYKIYGDKDATDLLERLTSQLKIFLEVTDTNFKERYDWFYSHIAPKIKLYEISPGESIILRSYTKSGYIKSLPLKVYGVYSFDGLEDSDLAGAINIIDLVSFRELYGQMSASAQAELSQMREKIGVKEINQENVENMLFGNDAEVEKSRSITTHDQQDRNEPIRFKPVLSEKFDPEEIKQGLALNAAIRLHDPTQLKQTAIELESALHSKQLDAKIVDWQAASGIVGQFVNIVRLVLIFAIVVIFIVALVIINNSIIVGTLNRTREIGTMRAIGAQKSFVAGLFLAETAIVSLIGAGLGALLSIWLLVVLQKNGIPAANDVVTFLFSGPRLYPSLRWSLIFNVPLFIVFLATTASTYAARYAARVKPADAMQEKE